MWIFWTSLWPPTYITNNQVYKNTSSDTTGLRGSYIQDRWEIICETERLYYPCREGQVFTGSNIDDRSGENGWCWVEIMYCHEENSTSGPNFADFGHGNNVPGYTPSQPGNGGSGTTNPNYTVGGITCEMDQANKFQERYHVDLITEEYEDIAITCASNIPQSPLGCPAQLNSSFAQCVKESIITTLRYSFLQKHNNSAEAIAFMDNMSTEIMHSDLFYLTEQGLEDIFESFKNLDEPTSPTDVPVTPALPMCPGMINFQYTSPNQTLLSAGLSNLTIILPVNGVNTSFTFNTVYFEVSPTGGLCGSNSQKAANAVNAALAATTVRLNNGTLYGSTQDPINERIRNTYLLEIYNSFYQQVSVCTPTSGSLKASVIMLGVGQQDIYNNLYNTTFNDMNNFPNNC